MKYLIDRSDQHPMLAKLRLGLPAEQVQQALHDRSRLSRSALLGIDRSRAYPFSGEIDMRQGLAEALQFEHGDLLDLFSSSVLASPEPRLSLEDFAHLSQDVVILRGYPAPVLTEMKRLREQGGSLCTATW